MGWERGGMTCSKWPQVRHEPWAAAVRTKPLYMGSMLYQLSYRGTKKTILNTFKVLYDRQLNLLQFLEDVSPLIQEASSVLVMITENVHQHVLNTHFVANVITTALLPLSCC